jgi:uncharacterized protein YneF (UPF0154 family)
MEILLSGVAFLAGVALGAWLEKRRMNKTLAERDRKISDLRLVLSIQGRDRC